MPTKGGAPLVSVIMGVRYRRENLFLLARAIRSILTQTYETLELLICQDNSTADACELMRQFAGQDLRVRLIDGNGADSLAKKLNRCLLAADGQWIARMDDDDNSHPERIAAQMRYLEHHSQLAFVGCTARLEQDGQIVGMRRLPERPEVKDFLFAQPFLHPTLLFRQEALEGVGGYCEAPRCDGCEDYDLLLRLYEAGFVGGNLQKPLLTYTLPSAKNKTRSMKMRWNEVKTRCVRYQSLHLLPKAWPYVVKPLAVGLLPERLLKHLKSRTQRQN